MMATRGTTLLLTLLGWLSLATSAFALGANPQSATVAPHGPGRTIALDSRRPGGGSAKAINRKKIEDEKRRKKRDRRRKIGSERAKRFSKTAHLLGARAYNLGAEMGMLVGDDGSGGVNRRAHLAAAQRVRDALEGFVPFKEKFQSVERDLLTEGKNGAHYENPGAGRWKYWKHINGFHTNAAHAYWLAGLLGEAEALAAGASRVKRPATAVRRLLEQAKRVMTFQLKPVSFDRRLIFNALQQVGKGPDFTTQQARNVSAAIRRARVAYRATIASHKTPPHYWHRLDKKASERTNPTPPNSQ